MFDEIHQHQISLPISIKHIYLKIQVMLDNREMTSRCNDSFTHSYLLKQLFDSKQRAAQ
jgi:flagellar biosynthesis regulator FlbT